MSEKKICKKAYMNLCDLTIKNPKLCDHAGFHDFSISCGIKCCPHKDANVKCVTAEHLD